MSKTYKFTIPFKGKVKTQMQLFTRKNGKPGMRKPDDVIRFEHEVRRVLEEAFPMEHRPIEGYLKFEVFHFTHYKRDKLKMLVPSVSVGDLDNVIKVLADIFQPVYRHETKVDKNGQPIMTKKGQVSTTKVVHKQGVIIDDKYITDVSAKWIPIEKDQLEHIEVYITQIPEEDLFHQIIHHDTKVIDLGNLDT